MTYARMLIAAGASPFRAPPSVVDLALAGWWNDVTGSPFTYNGKTYYSGVDDAGNIYVNAYNHGTGLAGTAFLIGSAWSSTSGDIHNSIGILARTSDHKLVIIEGSEEYASPVRRISTNAEDHTAWGSAAAVVTGSNTTYWELFQLSAESGKIYAFLTQKQSSVYRCSYMTSTDAGSTWSSIVDLVSPVSTTHTYHKVASNFVDRIDVYATDTDRALGTPSSVYHGYITGGNFYKSDGTLIGAANGGPYAASAMTLVQNTTYGSARPSGVAYDGAGRPACSINSRLVGGSLFENVRVARWSGSAWTTVAVADSNGQLISGSDLTKNDPNEAWMPRKIGSHLELCRYISPDDGATWSLAQQVTSASTVDNDAPRTPWNASRLRVLWGQGTYTGPSFTMAVKGLVTA